MLEEVFLLNIVEKASNFVRLGDFTMVKITDADDFDLFGVICE